jgi:hypothetical protein
MACTDVYPEGKCVSDGTASYYCCGSIYSPFCPTTQGSGACGTCDNYSLACAWPNVAGHPPNYAANCRPDLLIYDCGDLFNVISSCTLDSQCVYLSDHGPNTDEYCTHAPCRQDILCNGHIIDLTPAAFMGIASMSDGVTMVQVRQNCAGFPVC